MYAPVTKSTMNLMWTCTVTLLGVTFYPPGILFYDCNVKLVRFNEWKTHLIHAKSECYNKDNDWDYSDVYDNFYCFRSHKKACLLWLIIYIVT